MKSWLQTNNTKIHSTHKKIIEENQLIQNNLLELSRIKNMTAISKNVYIDSTWLICVHWETVNEHNNIIHRTMKPADVELETYINFTVDFTTKTHNLRLLVMYQFQSVKIFSKSYTANWPENVLVIKKRKYSTVVIYCRVEKSSRV